MTTVVRRRRPTPAPDGAATGHRQRRARPIVHRRHRAHDLPDQDPPTRRRHVRERGPGPLRDRRPHRVRHRRALARRPPLTMASSAIAFPLSRRRRAPCSTASRRSCEAEVIDRYAAHADLLDDVRRRYGPDGRYVPEVVDLIRAIRTASAAAGYFNLAVPAVDGRRRHGPRSPTTRRGSTSTTSAAAPTGWPSSPSATGPSARAPCSSGSPSGPPRRSCPASCRARR